MVRLHDIAPDQPKKARKRLGRGTGSGTGKTAGRGHKGQKSRSGGGVRPGFEGGQMPLFRRLPKRGFTSRNKPEYAEVNVGRLNELDGVDEVTPEILLDRGVIKQLKDGLVVLGDGEVTRAFTVKAHRFSKQAEEKIEGAGGKAEVI